MPQQQLLYKHHMRVSRHSQLRSAIFLLSSFTGCMTLLMAS